MSHNYCTAASTEYLHKVLALYNSIVRYDSSFCIYILCLETQAYDILTTLNLANTVLIRLNELEQEDGKLAAVKEDRTLREYAWTAKASIIIYIFRHYNNVPSLIWIDSDTMFLADPSMIFEKFSVYSILLTLERFTDEHKYLSEQYGTYQMGFIGFRRDENAILCLEWFREKLTDWCFDKFEDGRWADQKYADDWTERFKGVGIMDSTGVNMTPFILYTLIEDRKLKLSEKKGGVYAGNERITLFHYYGFKYHNSHEFDLCSYDMDFHDEAIRLVYLPYINEIKTAVEMIRNRTNVPLENKGFERGFICNYYNSELNKRYGWNICSIVERDLSIIQYEAIKKLLFKYPVHFWFCCNEEKSWQMLKNFQDDYITILWHENLDNENMKKLLKNGKQSEYKKAQAISLILHLAKNNYKIENCIYSDMDILGSINPDLLFGSRNGGYLFCTNSVESDIQELARDILKAKTVGVLRNEYSLRYLKLIEKKYIAEGLIDSEKGASDAVKQYSEWLEMFNGIRKI